MCWRGCRWRVADSIYYGMVGWIYRRVEGCCLLHRCTVWIAQGLVCVFLWLRRCSVDTFHRYYIYFLIWEIAWCVSLWILLARIHRQCQRCGVGWRFCPVVLPGLGKGVVLWSAVPYLPRGRGQWRQYQFCLLLVVGAHGSLLKLQLVFFLCLVFLRYMLGRFHQWSDPCTLRWRV